MLKRCAAFALVAILMAGASYITAFAGQDGPVVQGKGGLWAAGEGFIHLEGTGYAGLEGQGKGSPLIKNVSKTKIKILGKGKIVHFPKEDALVIMDLKGMVELTGKKLFMTCQGGPVKLHAKGDGAVWLKGKGVFKIGKNPPQKWPPKIKQFKY